MKLWKRASGALKDRNSLLIASLSRRSSYRNPDLEAVVIKATSHDETRVDYKNAQRVFAWIRTSAVYLKPLVCALSARLEKTHSWVVALKGLMLMHGVFFLQNPAVRRLGRLPFDLSNFDQGNYSNSSNVYGGGYNAFIRAYFAFLDQKSAYFGMVLKEERNNRGSKQTEEPMVQQLVKLQHFQTLLDMLIQVKPPAQGRRGCLVLEAMDCVIIEIFDIYSRICNGIALVLIRIYGARKVEASMALKVLQKATIQGEQLSRYFDFCRDFGVPNSADFPKVEQIPEEDIRDLERIINGVSERNETVVVAAAAAHHEEKALVVVRENGANNEVEEAKKGLKTIITHKWEVFDEEDVNFFNGGGGNNHGQEQFYDYDVGRRATSTVVTHDLLGTSLIIHPHVNGYKQEIPDLISF